MRLEDELSQLIQETRRGETECEGVEMALGKVDGGALRLKMYHDLGFDMMEVGDLVKVRVSKFTCI
jgi:hypothetical protein